MLGGREREARRTERYLDGLMDAEERGAERAPVDMDLDPAVLLAARELRASLVRVHPSFRFEDRLASRLAATARQLGGSGMEARSRRPRLTGSDMAPGVDFEGSPASTRGSRPARAARPLVFGGVGVASAASSLGAVYVAWRWTRASAPPMVRAARAARSGRSHTSGPGRRAGVLHGILG